MFFCYVLSSWLDDRNVYIGITKRPKDRLKEHKKEALLPFFKDRNTPKLRWLRGFLPSSPELLFMEILSEHVSLEEAKSEEIRLISLFKKCGWDVKNGTKGGQGTSGWVPSLETRQRQSASAKRFYGSPEGKAQLSSLMKVVQSRPEVNAKRAASMIGFRHSQETKEKISRTKKLRFQKGEKNGL